MRTLNGKTAVITGAARGIGFAIAAKLAEAGAAVVLADVSEKVLDSADRLVAQGLTAAGLRCDVTDPAQVEALMAHAVSRFGGIEILVNNAGIAVLAPALEMTPDQWDRVFAVNIRGAFLCSTAAGREMARQGRGGRIINISSISGSLGWKGDIAYSASKGALNALTRALAVELAHLKIGVNAVVPGTTVTDLNWERLYHDEQARQSRAAQIPWGELGKPEYVGDAVLFLASPQAYYITGQVLNVDGALGIAEI
jgi:NAD(P)-dependent dehydrogenase (short-subunit alcohol dehydrogenase family)